MTDTLPTTTDCPTPPMPHCAVIAVVGRTNSGKSTLVNQLVGEKVSIVSPVEQTTRNMVRGILTEDRGQLVFLDTPGLHKAESQLGTLMNKMARSASDATDAAMIVFDAASEEGVQMEDEGWMARALFMEQPILFVLNKSDDPHFDPAPFKDAWAAVQAQKETTKEVQWIEISAADNLNCDAVLEQLFQWAQPMPDYLFPEDIVTDFPRKLAISDVIREKLFKKLYQEVPHQLGVRVDMIIEQGATWEVHTTIFVNRAAQKGFVIGPKGRTLRYMRRAAEPEIADMFGLDKVSIQTTIKVEPNWFKNHFILKELGYINQ